jgi:hypothetical protein
MRLRFLVLALLVPSLALGDWYTQSTPTPLKVDKKPIPPGANAANFIRGSDWNDYVKAPTEQLRTKVKGLESSVSNIVLGNPNANDVAVTATGSTTARALKDRAADEVWITDHGAKCDNATDDTAALSAAITAAMTTGKTLRIPAGTCRINSVITIANDGATPPTQKPLRIVGSGAHMSGRGTAINGGSVLDVRGAGSYGKLVTSGLGLLEITGVTFTDSAGTSTPFIHTTNTTLLIHGNSFIGTKYLTACDQDAIVLGGTTEVEGFGGLNDGFQGYGTVIRDNYFNRIRRAVYGRTFANGVVVRDNTIWSGSGSNLSGGAAIEFDNPAASPTQYDVGNVIAGNLVEVVGYPYAIRLGRSNRNSIIGNNVYDPSVTTLAAVYFGASAAYNTLVSGYYADADILGYVDDSAGGTNLVIDARRGHLVATRSTFGLNFSPPGAAHSTQIYQGWPGQYDGALQIMRDTNPDTGVGTFLGGVNNSGSFVWGGTGPNAPALKVDTGGVLEAVQVYSPAFYPAGSTSLSLRGTSPDEAAATGVKIGNATALTQGSAAIVRFFSDSLTTEKARINSAGFPAFGGDGTTAQRMEWAAVAPTTGTWRQGDVVWNTGAAAGGAPGWVCTTAGTPGTWKAMANLAP